MYVRIYTRFKRLYKSSYKSIKLRYVQVIPLRDKNLIREFQRVSKNRWRMTNLYENYWFSSCVRKTFNRIRVTTNRQSNPICRENRTRVGNCKQRKWKVISSTAVGHCDRANWLTYVMYFIDLFINMLVCILYMEYL